MAFRGGRRYHYGTSHFEWGPVCGRHRRNDLGAECRRRDRSLADHAGWTDEINPRSPSVANGRVFVPIDTAIYALNPADGDRDWKYSTAKNLLQSPVVIGGSIVVAEGATLVVLDGGDGSKNAEFEIGGTGHLSGMAVLDGTALLGHTDSGTFRIHALSE